MTTNHARTGDGRKNNGKVESHWHRFFGFRFRLLLLDFVVVLSGDCQEKRKRCEEGQDHVEISKQRRSTRGLRNVSLLSPL